MMPRYHLMAFDPANSKTYNFGFWQRDAAMIAYHQTKKWHPDLFFYLVVTRYRLPVTAAKSDCT